MDLNTKDATALALSAHVPRGDVHPVVLNEFELAAWRDATGAVHLWEDRCPHRGMRLSFGFVRENRLTCLYHGWEYGADGGCKRIPAHPDLEPPDTLCTTRFSVTEACGMILLNGEDARDADQWHPVRTIFLPRAIAEVPLPAISDTPWSAEEPLHSGSISGHKLAAALHPVSADETALHVTTTHPDAGARVALARALVAYRITFSQEAT